MPDWRLGSPAASAMTIGNRLPATTKAATDRSYHGGSLRGGYGHGLAADVVSTLGATRADRRFTTDLLWKWIDEHEAEFSIGRPYLDRDPPHIGPIDGNEYIVKRALFGKRAS